MQVHLRQLILVHLNLRPRDMQAESGSSFCKTQKTGPWKEYMVRRLIMNFYRAMLCIRGTSHGPVSVCLSVCVRLSQAGVLLKRQNVGSHKQHHTIPQGV